MTDTYETQITVTAHNDVVDGYVELFEGMMVMSNLVSAKVGACKDVIDENHTALTVVLILRKPPLGSIGTDDYPDCEEYRKQNKK